MGENNYRGAELDALAESHGCLALTAVVEGAVAARTRLAACS